MGKEAQASWARAVTAAVVPGDGSVSLSLILPVYNCSSLLGETLESIARQKYPELEVIVVDAGSTDHTLEIVGSYPELINRLYTVTEPKLYEMMNRGISLASGKYVTVLLPGSFYLSCDALRSMASLAIRHDYPELLYCGSMQREGMRSPRMIYHTFDPQALQRGGHLTNLCASLFRRDLFDKLGKFRPEYKVRSGFDFLCRFAEHPEFRVASMPHVYVDFDFGHFTYRKLLKWATETFTILRVHYGWGKALKWFLGFSHLRFLRWWLITLKQSLFRV